MVNRDAVLTTLVAIVTWQSGAALGEVTCGGGTPPIYNQTFDVEKQVDAARYVQQSVFTNNSRGDYTLEFTAALQEGRERWTVTFEKDDDFEFIQHLDVDGTRQYTLKVADVNGTKHVTIETPTASATIAASLPLGDTTAIEALATQIAWERNIVLQVIQEVCTEMVNPGDNGHQDCLNDCPPWPFCPIGPVPADQCFDQYSCCSIDSVAFAECRGNCDCAFDPPAGADDCCANLAANIQGIQLQCLNNLLQCLTNNPQAPIVI
jgi:hypothetical protein